ncbi:MAG TPA: inositol monophosphatase family protein [Gemmatimonadota bacterium]|nr:inositol monophosphatase family protein [Gemmatimonadota bacterium]
MADASDAEEALAVAREAAGEAVDVLLAAWATTGRAEATRKRPRDLVTEADRESERRIVERLSRAFPEHAIVAEESGGRSGTSGLRWIVDPLDGTANYVHGFPMFAVSIALYEGETPLAGLVVDPVRGEWFSARAGAGAWLDRGDPADARRLTVAEAADEGPLLATGFPFRRPAEIDRYLRAFRELFLRSSDMRRAGSAALDLAYVAAGRVDGFWETGLSPWDIAAGELLVLEAGGRVSDWKGGAGHRGTGWIAAGGPETHRFLLSVLADA